MRRDKLIEANNHFAMCAACKKYFEDKYNVPKRMTVKRSAAVQKALDEIWKDDDLTTQNWMFSLWLIKKQLQEIEDCKFDSNVFLNEYADIAIIVIRFFMHLGLDPEKFLLKRLQERHAGRVDEIKAKYSKMFVAEQIKREIAISVPKEEIVKVARALMPPPAKRQALFERLWQSLIAYAQFGNRDFINAMLKYVRTLDTAYLVEAKIHISDAFCQLFLLCEFYGIDIDEMVKLDVERLKNHWKQEMLKEFKEYY